MAVAALTISIFALLVAIASVVYVRRQTCAAEKTAAIEQDRRRDELTPQFEATCTPIEGNRVELAVAFVGPPGLDRLDKVTLTISDDVRDRGPCRAGRATAEQIAAQIWGPYRFVPGVDGADQNGRAVEWVNPSRGDRRPFQLEPTLPPRWSCDAGEWWSQQYDGKPLRLTLCCWREGHEPWTVPREIVLGT